MLRAYLVEEKRCYNHPHRLVRTSCARCKTAYCDECLHTRTDGVFGRLVAKDEKRPSPLFCERCTAEMETIAAAEALRRRPLWQRLRPTRAQLRRAAAYVAVIAVLMVPLAIAVKWMAGTTLTSEDYARIKTGLLGTFQSPEGTNFLSQVYGGRFVRASAASRAEHDPGRLIDTWNTADVPGWRSQDTTVPQELVFTLPYPLRVNKVILRPHPEEAPETWVREFEVLTSPDSAERGFVTAVRGMLSIEAGRIAADLDRADPPRFEFPEQAAQYIMLRVLSNQGSHDYVSLGELQIYWVKKN